MEITTAYSVAGSEGRVMSSIEGEAGVGAERGRGRRGVGGMDSPLSWSLASFWPGNFVV